MSFHQLADILDALADDLPDLMHQSVGIIANEAADALKTVWPKLSGYSAGQWQALEYGQDWMLFCAATYSSHVHARGDESRTPIYPKLCAAAVNDVNRQYGLEFQMTDLTKPYIGKGYKYRRTNIIWLEMHGYVEPGTADLEPVLPTENVPGGLGGIISIPGA